MLHRHTLALLVLIGVVGAFSSSRADDEAQTQLVLSGVTVTDGGNYNQHMHGGPPAQVGHANLTLTADDDKEHQVTVDEIFLLHRHCRSEEWDDDPTPLAPVELHFEPESGEPAESKDGAPLTISGEGRLMTTFAAQEVYQACDAFGFRVTLTVDGESGTIEVPLSVKRYEPYRGP